MDISLKLGDYKLNVRAAGVIIHNNKVLLHKHKHEDHYALTGGRVKIGEDSAETVKREILEEMGKETEIIGYLSTIENFFDLDGTNYHEIMFVHRAEFIDENDKKIEDTIKNIEPGKESLNYEWVDLDKIDDYNLMPICMKSILKGQSNTGRYLNDDVNQVYKSF